MTRNWSSKSLGSRFQHTIFYKAISIGGWPVAYIMLFFITFWYTLLPKVRKRSYPYLHRRFPGIRGMQLWLHTLRLYGEFGKVLVDKARAGITGRCNAWSSPEDEQQLCALIKEQKGLILLSAHMGGWQLALPALGVLRDAPIHVVMHQSGADNDRQYFEHTESAPPFTIIDPKHGVKSSLSMLYALQRGEVLVFLGDRVFGNAKHTLGITFLGGTIRIPIAPYRLAAATGAPIAVCFAFRTGVGTTLLTIADIIRIPQRHYKNSDDFIPYAKAYVSTLEHAVQQYPHHFFNFYDLWEYTE